MAVDINYDVTSDITLKNYAIAISKNKFLLASDTPSELRLAFSFSSSKTINVNIKPLYPDWVCGSHGIGQSKLLLKGANIHRSWLLKPNQEIDLDLSVFQNDVINVSLTNSKQANCGRAEFIFSKDNQTDEYPIIYLSIWILIFLLLRSFKLPIAYASIGSVFNFLIVFANSTLTSLALPTLIYCSLQSLFIVGVLLIIQGLIRIKALNHILTVLVIVSASVFALVYIGYFLLFGAPISNDTIQAVLQSNLSETLQFLASSVGVIKILIITFIISIIIKYIISLQNKFISIRIPTLLVACIMMLPAIASRSFQLDNSPVLNQVTSSTINYFHEIKTFESLKESRANTLALTDVSLANEPQTLVVIIGESANKNHMSLYGYPRETTPNADRLLLSGEIIRFNRAYANHIHTGGALTNALTLANQYNNKHWVASPSLIGIANAVDVDTTWITNQQILGAWDNHVSVLAQEATTVVPRNKLIGTSKDASQYDGILVEELEKRLLETNDKSELIFIHLQGSHASYCRRFPDTHAVFKNKSTITADFGNLGKKIQKLNNSAVNCYDNSIYYTDSLIAQITAILNKHKKPTAMLYFSDHSEDVINNSAHITALFTYDMTEIPMLFWANQMWRTTFKTTWTNLTNNSQKLFTNDHIFETVLGLIGISSKGIEVANDLSSVHFQEVTQPSTLLGSKPIDVIDNWHYWQQLNTTEIVADEQCERLIPHRANSLGKIRTAITEGLCGFEIDVYIDKQQGVTVLNVGHDKNAMSGATLDAILEKAKFNNFNKIWLDVKNINAANIDDLISRLDYLDKKFSLKSKAIIESGYYGETTKAIKLAGYQLSYYLPTGKINNSMGMPPSEQQKFARVLEQRIVIMNASEISFDLKSYPFVKTYLEPLLDSKIDKYHTWFPSGLAADTPNLLEKLAQKDYFQDSRVKTILLTYRSPYSL